MKIIKENIIQKSLRMFMFAFISAMMLVLPNITAYAYDEDVIEYIAKAIENTQTTVDVESYDVKTDELMEVFELAKAENYELAYTYDWIRVGSWRYSGTKLYSFDILYDFDNATTNAEVKSRYSKVVAELDKIEAMINKNWSDEEKILFVHDYLVNRVSYDFESYKDGTIDDAQLCLYGALIDSNAVCEGYSKAFMVMMHRLGIDCKLVASETMQHMWNVVKLDGSWYHIDLTWDDPIMSGADEDLPGRVDHNNFLLSDNGISKTHVGWDATAPKCNNTKYDNWAYADSTSMFLYIDGCWYYSHPDKDDNLVKKNSNGDETVLTDNGAYGLAQIDGRIYYTDKYRKKIYRYYNGTSTLVYTASSDYYVSSIGIDGSKVTISEFDESYAYRWIYRYVDCSYDFTANKVEYSSVVSGVKATSNKSTSVTLSWTAAPSAVEYKIYTYNASTKKYTLKCTTSSTSCTVTGLSAAQEYTFVIKACTSQLGKKVESAKEVTYKTTTIPNGVSSVTYVKSWTTSVVVKYPAVSGATGYRLQVYNYTTGKVVKTMYVTKLQNTISGLNKGTKYKVVVTPYKTYNGKKYYSTVKKDTLAATKTANPTVKVSAQTTKTVTLSWNKVAGATGYYVYKYNSKTGKYVQYKKVTTTSCKISGLNPGKTYTFAVKPYVSISYKSNGVTKTKVFDSSLVTFKACTTPASPKPTLTTSKKTVTAKWSKVTGATSYVVYYKKSASGKWIKAKTTTKTSYKISGLVKGKKCYVKVVANKKYNKQNAVSGYTTKSIVVK